MKLTFSWRPNAGEGKPSKTDTERLMALAEREAGDWVTVCDFLADVSYEADRLYKDAVALSAKAYLNTGKLEQ